MSHPTSQLPNDTDRRQGPRVPLAGPVRMGPPHGDPYALVSASDLSRFGLFIDADRPVRVGARFSAEIELPSGERVYVPEAEVAYNRERPTGSGFGVRFVDPPAEIVERLDEVIERVRAPMSKVIAPPTTPPVSEFEVLDAKSVEEEAAPVKTDNFDPDSATEIPKKSRQLELDMTKFPEPAFELGSMPPEMTATPQREEGRTIRDRWEDIMRMGQDAKHRFVERARRFPPVWTGIAAIGLFTVLSAVGLALWMGSSAEAVEVKVKPDARGMTATTQHALMGEAKLAAVEAPSAEPSDSAQAAPAGEAKKPLPPLVVVDENSASVVKKPELEAEEPPLVAPPKVEHAKKSKSAKAEAKEKASKSEAKDAKAEAKASKEAKDAKAEAKDSKDSKVAKAEAKASKEAKEAKVAKSESKSAKADAKSDAKASKSDAKKLAKSEPKSAKAGARTKLHLGLDAGASVSKTYVFSNPDRFVIDLAGQTSSPSVPAASGVVKGVRFGKHPDHVRVVIETTGKIEHGLLSKSGRDLQVTIELAR